MFFSTRDCFFNPDLSFEPGDPLFQLSYGDRLLQLNKRSLNSRTGILVYLCEGSAGAAQPLKHAENTCGMHFLEYFTKSDNIESSSTGSSSPADYPYEGGCEVGPRKVGPRMVESKELGST